MTGQTFHSVGGMLNEKKQKLPLNRHCEQSEAIQKTWIAAPLVAARDDEVDDLQVALVG